MGVCPFEVYNMNPYVIFADTASDISPARAGEYDVRLIELSVMMNGQPLTDLNEADFYRRMRAGEVSSTSAANVETFLKSFERELAAGNDVLYIAFSSGLSGTCGCATIAAEELSEKYPERKVRVADSLSAASGYGLLVYYAAHMKRDGKSLDEIYDFVIEKRLNLCHQFTVDDLFFLKRGGRISAATAIAGSMLNIKPVLHVDNEGHLVNIAKARGRRAAIKALADKMAESAIDPATQKVFIGHGDCIEDAHLLADMIRDRMGVTDIDIYYIGPVIGAHSGPGTLALFYMGSER